MKQQLKIGKDIKLAKFIEKEIKEEKSSPEVVEYKIKKAKFSTTLCFKTIYDYIDKEILEIERKDLTYGNYARKEDNKKKESERIKPNKEAKTVGKALDKIERKLGVVKFRETFKTITTDNGGEFKNWKIIEKSYTGGKKARTTQYYADAYSSWQRGTNENINKMIRRFLPKGTSFKNLKQEEVKRIEKWINNNPRKILKFKTLEEYYREEMKVA